MTAAEVRKWEDALRDACFPVTLADVHVGNPPRCAKREEGWSDSQQDE